MLFSIPVGGASLTANPDPNMLGLHFCLLKIAVTLCFKSTRQDKVAFSCICHCLYYMLWGMSLPMQ